MEDYTAEKKKSKNKQLLRNQQRKPAKKIAKVS